MAVEYYYKIQGVAVVPCPEHCKDLEKTAVSIRKLFSVYSLLTPCLTLAIGAIHFTICTATTAEVADHCKLIIWK